MYNEFNAYNESFGLSVRSGEGCKGEDCGGWILSEVDTWHECPCNSAKGYPHPEMEVERYGYVVFQKFSTGWYAIASSDRLDLAKRTARSCRDALVNRGRSGEILLRLVVGDDEMGQVELQIEKLSDCASD